MGSTRERILETTASLVHEQRAAPSLDVIAARAGVSKGGLLHHFPDRQSLVAALVRSSVAAASAALEDAAPRGRVVRTWLELSVPSARDLAVAQAVMAIGSGTLPPEVGDFVRRSERLLADEVGSPVLARVIRLTGDGLFTDTLAGRPPTRADIDDLVAYFETLA